MFKDLRVVIASIVAIVFLSGAADAYSAIVKRVDINDGSKVISLNTTKKTVGDVLTDMSVIIAQGDIVQPPVTAEVTDGLQINILRAFMVNVTVDGAPKQVRTNNGTISDVIEKVENSIKTETKLLGANETDRLAPNMAIELVTTYTETEEIESPIAFETVYTENDTVLEGTETVLSEGGDGILITVYEKLYEGNELISTLAAETIVKAEPVDRVIEIGTMPPPKPTIPNTALTYSSVITMRASAYTTDKGDAGPITATGERARVGLVAVDPKFIPMGTRLYVVGYGECRAADTGGMIKGNAIDLFFNTYEECVNFGRREVTVYVLD